jgi:hypothetical protein
MEFVAGVLVGIAVAAGLAYGLARLLRYWMR